MFKKLTGGTLSVSPGVGGGRDVEPPGASVVVHVEAVAAVVALVGLDPLAGGARLAVQEVQAAVGRRRFY